MIMDRSVIQERLAETEERIANGENQIAQQRRLIAELKTNGSPASHAKYLLAGLELLQTARRDSRDWLLKQLGPGFWSQVQQGYAKRICTSLPSSLRIA